MSETADVRSYSYADIQSWDDGDKYELIEGVLYPVEAISTAHASVHSYLHLQFGYFLNGKKCKLYFSPFAVHLFARKDSKADNDKTIVQPDLSIICDSDKISTKGCYGAPDLVVEIVSPSTESVDTGRKWTLYEKAGVGEYWIVNPETKTVHVYLLENGRFSPVVRLYRQNDRVAVHVLKGCVIDLAQVFQDV